MELVEKKVLMFGINKTHLLKPESFKNVIGIFTEGIATCSSLIISFENDKYIIFSHFNEYYDIFFEVKNIIINDMGKFGEKFSQIYIFYSKGIGPLNNKSINHGEIFDKFTNFFNSSYLNIKKNNIHLYVKEHNAPISLLKIFSQYKEDFLNIINLTFQNLKKKKIPKIVLDECVEIFCKEKNEIHSIFLISYYFNYQLLGKIMSILNYSFIMDN